VRFGALVAAVAFAAAALAVDPAFAARTPHPVRVTPPSLRPPEVGRTPAVEQLLEHGYLVPNRAAYEREKAESRSRAESIEPESGGRPRAASTFRSWEGVNDGTITPPDTNGAIGPDRYVQLVNLRYAIYSRFSDAPLASGSLAELTGNFSGSLTDPRVIWDPDTDRFYYVALDYASNIFAFGFSRTDSPTSAADWCKYTLDYGYGFLIPDYPMLGDTQNLILIGANIFDSFGSWYGSDMNWLTKPPPGDTCPPGGTFRGDQQIVVLNPNGSWAFTPHPAVQTDGSTTGHVIAADWNTHDNLTLFEVTLNADGSPNIPRRGVAVPVTSFAIPPDAPQPGTSLVLDTLDMRLTNAVSAYDPLRGGIGVWTQHTVAGGRGSEVRWYEVDPAARTVFQAEAASDSSLYVFNGAIAPDRVSYGSRTAFGGSMALGFNTSSPAAYPAIQQVTKLGGGAQSAFELVKQSPGPNVDVTCAVRCRWGDYASAMPDPAAPTTAPSGRVWLSNQWNVSSASSTDADWRTWNWGVAVEAPPPPPPPPPPAIASFFAYSNFSGGVRVAGGDVTGDGVADIVTGPGPGTDAIVKIFDGATLTQIDSFVAFTDFTGGVFVAAGDVTGDGKADIITGAGPGAGANVKVFDGATRTQLDSFFAFTDFGGGVRVAAGDVTGDGKADIITGAGPGAGANVKVFDGATRTQLDSFFAFTDFNGGVFVGAGDVTADGRADILAGAGPGAGANVKVFDGATRTPLASLFAFTDFRGGVQVAGGDVTGDGRADIVAGAGPGAGANVKIFDGATYSQLSSFFVFGDFAGGVFVGTGDLTGDGRADLIAGAGPGGGANVKIFNATDVD
jgi:hypothetical protein